MISMDILQLRVSVYASRISSKNTCIPLFKEYSQVFHQGSFQGILKYMQLFVKFNRLRGNIPGVAIVVDEVMEIPVVIHQCCLSRLLTSNLKLQSGGMPTFSLRGVSEIISADIDD